MPGHSTQSPGDPPGGQSSGEESDVGSLSLGDRLRSARKARALSLDQVARELHLEESIIADLENERFESLGAPVFVRGHLKLYARLIGLNEDDVLQAYRQVAPGSDEPPLVASSQPVQQDINLGLWGFWVLVVVVLLAVVFYVFQPEPAAVARVDRQSPAAEPADRSARDVPESAGEAVAVLPAAGSPDRVPPAGPDAEPGPDTADESAAGREPPGAALAPESPAPAVITPAAVTAGTPPGDSDAAQGGQETRLILIFGEESWVEISDADRRLLFGLQQPGVRRELSGRPPFRVLLGNARSVNIYVNDTPYSIPDDQIRRNVARFEIGPPAND